MGKPSEMQPPAYPGEDTASLNEMHDMPRPQIPQSKQFETFTPISNLSRFPAPVECSACNQRDVTLTSYKLGHITRYFPSNRETWKTRLICFSAQALGTGVVTWFFWWMPYCVSSTKDVRHKCSNCGTHLATWHRSGHTEVCLYK